ncbi:MAG: AMP-dependent synthetase/ligase [Acidobacteriota bacterium]
MTPATATLVDLLHRWLTVHPTDRAIGTGPGPDRMSWLSTAELAERIRAVAMGLQSVGVGPGDRVALLSENRWEWVVADFGILTARAINVPVHPGLTAGQIAFILADSGARLAFASTPELTGRLLEARRQVPSLTDVVTFDGLPAPAEAVTTLAAFLAQGRAHAEGHPGQYRRQREGVKAEDPASIIYTSGTTGDPKGVVLTHANFASNITACCNVFDFLPTDLGLSFLPLCHVFQRTVDYCYYHSGCRVVHLSDLTRISQAFETLHPSTFAAVPRLYEKMYARIQDSVPDSKRRLFDRAVAGGVRRFRRHRAGRRLGPTQALSAWLAERLVFRHIRERLGGRWRFAISGGAPLAAEIAEFFNGIGLPVLEGYGLTETSPVIATNRLADTRPGTVGRPLPGVEVRIAADGEVMTRGPHVMQGYWHDPDKTAATIDADGWLATGDLGRLDADGFLSITDRKKEILVTAQGKNIAPQPLENALKQLSLVSQAMVVGDRRPFLVALIVPDFEVLLSRAARLGIRPGAPEDLVADPAVEAAIAAQLDTLRPRLAHHEQIRRFALLAGEFTQERDELTPTLKLKRRIILKHHAATIESLYAGHEQPRPAVV